MINRPYVFIGCSLEGLDYAEAIQQNLEFICESHIWSQGLFGLSDGTLETLVKSINKFDFAILVITPDDITISRDKETASPRDNVIFELGLFMGGLGKERVFLVIDRSASPKLPSDLAGITPASFIPPNKGNSQSALGTASTEIKNKIRALGAREQSDPISNTKDFENALTIITTYLQTKNKTMISFEGLKKYVNKKYDENYINYLIETFPTKITRSVLAGDKPGIKLLELTKESVADDILTSVKASIEKYKPARLAIPEVKRLINSLSKAKHNFIKIDEIGESTVISKKRLKEVIQHLIDHGFAEMKTGFEGEDYILLKKKPIRIYSATYKWVDGQEDVTEKINELVNQGIFEGTVIPSTFGIGDPKHGTEKTLHLHYRIFGEERAGEFKDYETFIIK